MPPKRRQPFISDVRGELEKLVVAQPSEEILLATNLSFSPASPVAALQKEERSSVSPLNQAQEGLVSPVTKQEGIVSPVTKQEGIIVSPSSLLLASPTGVLPMPAFSPSAAAADRNSPPPPLAEIPTADDAVAIKQLLRRLGVEVPAESVLNSVLLVLPHSPKQPIQQIQQIQSDSKQQEQETSLGGGDGAVAANPPAAIQPILTGDEIALEQLSRSLLLLQKAASKVAVDELGATSWGCLAMQNGDSMIANKSSLVSLAAGTKKVRCIVNVFDRVFERCAREANMCLQILKEDNQQQQQEEVIFRALQMGEGEGGCGTMQQLAEMDAAVEQLLTLLQRRTQSVCSQIAAEARRAAAVTDDTDAPMHQEAAEEQLEEKNIEKLEEDEQTQQDVQQPQEEEPNVAATEEEHEGELFGEKQQALEEEEGKKKEEEEVQEEEQQEEEQQEEEQQEEEQQEEPEEESFVLAQLKKAVGASDVSQRRFLLRFSHVMDRVASAVVVDITNFARTDSWQRAMCSAFDTIEDACFCIGCVLILRENGEKGSVIDTLNYALRGVYGTDLPLPPSGNGADLTLLVDGAKRFCQAMPKYTQGALCCCQSRLFSAHHMLLSFTLPYFYVTSPSAPRACADLICRCAADRKEEEDGERKDGEIEGTSFAAMISCSGVDISPFVGETDGNNGSDSQLPSSQILLPPGTQFEIIYTVPLSHFQFFSPLYISPPPMFVAKDAAIDLFLSPTAQVRQTLGAFSAVARAHGVLQGLISNIYPPEPQTAQQFPVANVNEYVEQTLQSKSTGSTVKISQFISSFLVQPGDQTWTFIVGDGGAGKTTAGVVMNSRICGEMLHGFASLWVPLPDINGGSAFESVVLENWVQKQLRLDAEGMKILRASKLVLILDRLEQAKTLDAGRWRNTAFAPSLSDTKRWQNLRVVITCSSDHLKQNRLTVPVLSQKKGMEWEIKTFTNEECSQLVEAFAPDKKFASRIVAAYQSLSRVFQSPLLLWLLAQAATTRNYDLGAATVFNIYEQGLMAIIERNACRRKRLREFNVDVMFHWCKRLAVVMSSKGELRGQLSTFLREPAVSHATMGLSPEQLLAVAPLRVSFCRASGIFEFRHRLLQEFLVAHAMRHLHGVSVQLLPFLAQIRSLPPIPGVSAFVGLYQQQLNNAFAHRRKGPPLLQVLAGWLPKQAVVVLDGAVTTTPVSDLMPTLRASSSLVSVQLSETTMVSDALLCEIAQRSPTLAFLDVSFTNGRVTDASIGEVARLCHNLRSLNVMCTSGKITSTSITEVARQCAELQSLNMSETNSKISDAAVIEIAKHCSKLLHLDVSGNDLWITDDSIKEIAVHCSQLEYLDVSRTAGRVTDTSVGLVATNCRFLKSLNVSNTGAAISNRTVLSLARNCFQLTHLDLGVWTSCNGGTVTDEAIAEIAFSCLALQTLSVRGTEGKISDASICVVARRCRLLTALDVSWTGRMVTDKSIIEIASNCALLEVLDVSGTGGCVTDASLLQVARKCRHLSRLDVSYTKGKVTDATISEVARCCVGLRSLNVRCTEQGISDSSISDIAQFCTRLQILDVSLGKITQEALALFPSSVKIEH